MAEAGTAGAGLAAICATLAVSTRTLQRWRSGTGGDARKGAAKHVANKLSIAEAQAVVDIACCPEYRGMTPMEIVPTLAANDRYLASESTFYRVLKSRNLLHHRSSSAPAQRPNRPAELIATAPNQVWSWDITYLRSLVAGIYYFAYLVMDIYSRKIVGWEIAASESDSISAAMMARLNLEQDLRGLHLHSDRGNPMKGATMVMKLYELGVMASYSRPRVSDDNPYSEALFKTAKYHKTYPGKFTSEAEARAWFAEFIHWYNTEHLHSAIGYVTPTARHQGIAQAIYDKRNKTYARAQAAHPERWANKLKVWAGPAMVYLNPSEETKFQNKPKAAA